MWYKKFAEQSDIALAEYKTFWFSKFNKALKWYFPFVNSSSTMILGASRRNNNYVRLYEGRGMSGILCFDRGRTANTEVLLSDS